MLELKSEDNFYIENKGYVFIIKKPGITHGELERAVSGIIAINDNKYKCLAYGQDTLGYLNNTIINHPFSILVTPIKQKTKKYKHVQTKK